MTKTPKTKLHILVVEDEQISLDMLVLILESTNKVNCFKAKSGKEAISFYKNNQIDCTFLDINIPSPNGIETLKIIKSINKNAIVVMQTSSNDRETVKTAIKLGATSYIVKPYEPDKIFNALNKVLY